MGISSNFTSFFKESQDWIKVEAFDVRVRPLLKEEYDYLYLYDLNRNFFSDFKKKFKPTVVNALYKLVNEDSQMFWLQGAEHEIPPKKKGIWDDLYVMTGVDLSYNQLYHWDKAAWWILNEEDLNNLRRNTRHFQTDEDYVKFNLDIKKVTARELYSDLDPKSKELFGGMLDEL